jgi:hypothetical protein
MRFPVSDPAAVAFSRILYTELAAGATLDAAVTSGRKGMATGASLEWANPALFLRLRDGRIWRSQERGAVGAQQADVFQRAQVKELEAEELDVTAYRGSSGPAGRGTVHHEVDLERAASKRATFVAYDSREGKEDPS